MKVVLDTNIILAILSRKSNYNHIFQALLSGEFVLCVTTEILEEYEEILERFYGTDFARSVLELLVELPNTEFIHTYFAWNIIEGDPDDNKFFDCAVAANARYIVSEDRHFHVIKEIPFPKVELLKIDEFYQLLTKSSENPSSK